MRGIFSEILNFLFSLTENQEVKPLEKNVTSLLIQNQNLQQSFMETHAQVNSITHIHLTKNRYMINELVNTLKKYQQ